MRMLAAMLSQKQMATTITIYYVRQAGGNYGSEDGTSYANAFDGEADIEWGELDNKTLIAVGFPVDSITSQNPTTTIKYAGGIGSMVVGDSFIIT